jgi:hypothetical protein
MKSLIACTLLVLAGAGFLLPEGTPTQVEEEEAIKRVLLAETDFFFARNYEGWASTFVQEPGAIQIWNNGDGSYTHSVGWETISKNVKAFMESHPEPNATPLWRENFVFRHYGDAAFVTFDKYMGDRATAKPIKEVRVVEKVDGEWKIVCVAAFINYVEV